MYIVMDPSSSSASLNPTVKIAGLWKRSQGLSLIGSRNYKHRVFILTDQVLSYYSGTVDRIGQLKRQIPIESIRAVEFVNESAFNLPHMLQIVYVSKKHGYVTLYVIARDKAESADWVSSLRNACYFNQDMLMHYHPGILIKNKWDCCHQNGKTALGCQPSYHLLTRSSSRYAQMRRKDTLYSFNSKRSSGHQTEMRRSTVCAERPVSERSKNIIAVSNSCVNLTSCIPNALESLNQATNDDPCPLAAESPCNHEGDNSLSSSHEDEHSLSPPLHQEATSSPSGNECVVYRRCSHQRNSYVAPEELSCNVTHFVLGHGPNVRHRSSEPLTYSSVLVRSCTDVGSKQKDFSAGRWGMSPRKRDKKMSGSLSTLSKPTIEPKISNSDPTVFHV